MEIYVESDVSYYVWYSIIWFGTICTLFQNLYFLKKVNSSKYFHIAVLLSGLGFIVMRIIWLILLRNGRNSSTIYYPIDILLVRLGQIAVLTQIFIVLYLWRIVIYSCEQLQRISFSKIKAKRNTIIFSIILNIIIIPISIIGLFNEMINKISDYIIGIIIIFLIIGGIRYCIKINKLLARVTPSKKGIGVFLHINKLLLCIFSLTFLSFIGITLVICNSLQLFNTSYLKLWVWWLGIHLLEIIIEMIVVTTLNLQPI